LEHLLLLWRRSLKNGKGGQLRSNLKKKPRKKKIYTGVRFPLARQGDGAVLTAEKKIVPRVIKAEKKRRDYRKLEERGGKKGRQKGKKKNSSPTKKN